MACKKVRKYYLLMLVPGSQGGILTTVQPLIAYYSLNSDN